MKQLFNMDKLIFQWGTYSLTFRMLFGTIVIIAIVNVILILTKSFIKKQIKNGENHQNRLLSIFQLLKYFLWVLAITLILDQLGIKLTLLLAGSAALLVGLGLGVQQTFNDVISGIIILAEGTLKINDIVEVDGLVGKVNEINMRTSEIVTRDGIYIIVPNHKLINEYVINWSHHSKATRFKVNVGVDYNSDVELVKKILFNCINAEEQVIKNEEENFPIYVRITDFGDSAINFEILFWSNEIFSVEQIKSNIRFRILQQFRVHNIIIPFPQTDVHIKNNNLNESS